ncbi:MAG TPA: diacylglycerol kinase family protein [Actinomycetota bacterium]|nr:diacylglycerol kinase family protein [Actinomycetota bacterium]
MTSGAGGRATPRLWAVAALAGLVLLAAGLVQVVVGSREQLLQLLVGTVLSLAVVAATAWWAFTTRRVWKRWLNTAIATLAVANVLLGFVEFGYRQAAGALAIVAGALAYATATRHALRPPTPWTTPAPDPAGGRPARPWLLVNPRSGDGKAGRVGLVEAARAREVRVHMLAEGDDPGALARRAVAEGADAVGVAGGDGSLGVVAAVAVEADVPFVCVPSGTRNHFAGDLGLDRTHPVAALEAFAGPERRVDVGVVGDRMFLNNVSLGAYADLVADPRYRAGKLATAHAVLPASLRGERELLQVDLGDADRRRHPDVLVLLVAANRYELNGVRERLDGGLLQVSALRARTGAALAGLASTALARGGRPLAGAGWAQWTTTSLRVDAALPELPAGIDGEAAVLATPLEFRLLPLALRVLVPPALGPGTPRVRLQRWATVRSLLRVAAGQPGGPTTSDRTERTTRSV